MRAVVQRVSRAEVRVAGEVVGKIDAGLAVLVGVGQGDDADAAAELARKVAGLRVFEDDDGKMNRSVAEAGGAVLAVSQFTLFGDCRKGRRPSFIAAARPEAAEPLFEAFVARLRDTGLTVATGRFRTTMEVDLVNAGPVTLLIDSEKAF
ncbi:MAG: D-aminoacyl-tRNA deacylase [Planctomycetota bacterium]